MAEDLVHNVAMATWMLDELGHAGQEHLNPAYVAGYDSKAGYDPTPDVARLIELGLGPDSTVVDLGAGTGGQADRYRACRRQPPPF